MSAYFTILLAAREIARQPRVLGIDRDEVVSRHRQISPALRISRHTTDNGAQRATESIKLTNALR